MTDLISSLASTLGVDAAKATALAGGVLGPIVSSVSDDDASAGAAVKSAIPELGGWERAANAALGGGGSESGGGLLGAASGLLGGGAGGMLGGSAGGMLGALAGAVGGDEARSTVQVGALLSDLGIDASKAALVAPLLLNFLKDRLSGDVLDKVLAAAPMLASVAGGKGAAGMLGGLFGKS